jgi:hypothetical protein
MKKTPFFCPTSNAKRKFAPYIGRRKYMKKHVIIFAVLAAILPAACVGPAGPQGIQGEKGEAGKKGDKGESGADGLSIVWQGELDKAPYPAYENWAYYNKVDKKAYIYDGESWQILVKDGEAGPKGPKGETGEKGDSLYMVKFNASGGAFADGNEIKKAAAEEKLPIAPPEEPVSAWGVFLGWYTQPAGGVLFEFTTPITASITLYARWLFDKNILTDWLENQSGGDGEDDPLCLKVNINLDDDWQKLLEAIEAGKKFIELDLSLCDMSGTIFNPDSGIKTGKNKIVSITLPDKATEIAKGNSTITSAFNGFSNLRSFNAANLTDIGAFAFYGCSKLALTELPESLIKINRYSFRNCVSLAIKTIPTGVTEIGTYAFSGCTSLTEMTLYEKITSIGASAFSECNNLKFFTCLAEKPPTLGTSIFGKNSNFAINVPEASLNAYQEAAGWKDLADKISAINS